LIYFVQSPDGGPVKIGHSGDFPTRVRQLEAHYGQPLAVLATMDGGREEEAELHHRFAHLRLGRTEQFRPASDLVAYIGRPVGPPGGGSTEPLVPTSASIAIKGSPEYRDWINSVSKDTLIPVASIVRDAVAKWAIGRGYTAPPEL
jgi:Meiotically up-regulated gene 113